MTRGVKSTYKPEYAEQARKLCLLGATDKELADFFGCNEATINNWKTRHPDFLESIKKGKDIADGDVADRLYRRAMGYSHEDEDIRTISIGDGMSEIIKTPTVKHYPPDTTAAIFWLKNRQKGKWRDKQEVEQSGAVTYKVVTGIPDNDGDADD